MTKREIVDALAPYHDDDEVAIQAGTLPMMSIEALNEGLTLTNGKVVFDGGFYAQKGYSDSGYVKKGTFTANGKRRGRPAKPTDRTEPKARVKDGRGRPRLTEEEKAERAAERARLREEERVKEEARLAKQREKSRRKRERAKARKLAEAQALQENPSVE